jgi:Amt family ammonium transporter
MGWIIVEWIRDGKPTLVGASSGAVAGLVAITPACAFIAPWSAVVLGLVAGAVCALAVALKYRLGYDDSLDVVAVHFVAGWIGTLWIGLFASEEIAPFITDPEGLGVDQGLFYGGGGIQLGRQALAALIVTVMSFVIAAILALLIDKTVGFRAKPEVEADGIDVGEHAESAYDFSSSTGGGLAMAGVTGRPGASGSPDASAGSSPSESEKVAG